MCIDPFAAGVEGRGQVDDMAGRSASQWNGRAMHHNSASFTKVAEERK